MPNDFLPEEGRKFTFVPDHPTPWEGNVECEVLELEPGKRMVWSWRTRGMERASRVAIELIPKARGTELVFRHRGVAEGPVAGGLEDGWPEMLAGLGRGLGANGKEKRT